MLNFIPLSLSLVCSTDNNDCQKIVLDSLEKVVSSLEKVLLGSYGEVVLDSLEKVLLGSYREVVLGSFWEAIGDGSRVGWCGDTHKPIGYDQ